MFQRVESASMDGKTKPISFRLSADLYARLQEIKRAQAHPKINDSEFLVEAVKLYVALAEEFGLDKELMIAESIGRYRPASQGQEKKQVKEKRAAQH